MKLPTCFLALATLALAGAVSGQTIRATVDGDAVSFDDVQPLMNNGRVFVPVRGVFEHMKADVVWDADAQIVTATRASDVIVLPLNSTTATVNGRRITLDAPARLVRGRTMVPLRFLSESLGASVDWIAASRTVEITTSAIHTTPPIQTGYTLMTMDTGTVIPFSLDQALSSNKSSVGDKFTATIDTGTSGDYQGLVKGAVLEGHVDVARAKVDDVPGVLGLKCPHRS